MLFDQSICRPDTLNKGENDMKYPVLLAVVVATMIAACSKEGPSSYSSSPATKPQASEGPTTVPPKSEAPASTQPPAVAASPSLESRPGESSGVGLSGGEAKPAQATPTPAGEQQTKKEENK
jgi:hypothetical protein